MIPPDVPPPFGGTHPLVAYKDAIGLGEIFELIDVDDPPPPPPETGDMIPFAGAQWTGGDDPRAWPVTSPITLITTHENGFVITFSKKYDNAVTGPRWPNVIPLGWTGPVYYTIALGAQLGDGWHVAAALNVYFDQAAPLGGPVLIAAQYPRNLWYLDPALQAHTPRVGESIALVVIAGGLRGINAISVRERSQVVTFPFSPSPAVLAF